MRVQLSEVNVKLSLKVVRGVQLVGALFLVAAVVSFVDHGTAFAWEAALGLLLILGARIYDWMTRA